MTELINVAGIIITVGLCALAGATLWLHTWMRMVEQGEGEDDDE